MTKTVIDTQVVVDVVERLDSLLHWLNVEGSMASDMECQIVKELIGQLESTTSEAYMRQYAIKEVCNEKKA